MPARRSPSKLVGKPPPKLTPFLQKVRRAIRSIPRGQTLSYGGVALVCGVPQGARAVVRALHSLDDVPWWRVCRSDGTFAPQCLPQQEVLLRQEGWKPRPKKSRKKAGAISASAKAREAAVRKAFPRGAKIGSTAARKTGGARRTVR